MVHFPFSGRAIFITFTLFTTNRSEIGRLKPEHAFNAWFQNTVAQASMIYLMCLINLTHVDNEHRPYSFPVDPDNSRNKSKSPVTL